MNPLESAYLSAVLLAQSLVKMDHAKAMDASKLKDALAKALTHPDTMRGDAFQQLWNTRTQFSALKLNGEMGDIATRHATILAKTNL